MPRLLPRLLKALEKTSAFGPETFNGPLLRKSRRRKSLWKPVPDLSETKTALSASERTHSLLLDEDNIIINPGRYKRRKKMPPAVKTDNKHTHMKDVHDTPREMTGEEKQWWSSPYLRMLSSPVRKCTVTKRHLPADFLVRLVAVAVPRPRLSPGATTIVPDGLLHPRFTGRVCGAGHYILCWRHVVNTMFERNVHKRLSLASNLTVHSLLVPQIGHLLRVRVLQELEMLIARLRASPRNPVEDIVIRRLTRSEWTEMRSTGVIPWQAAICVLVVPPLNRDPESKQRTKPHFSSLPPEEPPKESKPLPPLPPIATFHLTQEAEYTEPLPFLKDQHIPHAKVPLYNGLSLFPSRDQRAALHKRLCEALNVERKARSKVGIRADGKEKASHAFVLFSNERTVSRADTVPLAIALWRVRMWEGEGWEDGPTWQESK